MSSNVTIRDLHLDGDPANIWGSEVKVLVTAWKLSIAISVEAKWWELAEMSGNGVL